MPTRVTIAALVDVPYEGRVVLAGEHFTVPPYDAAKLIYRRKARFLRASETASAPRPKRQYRRRDLTAESSDR